MSKVIWVSEEGSDTIGTGSRANPYASIEQALTVFVDTDQIRLERGTYTPTDSVVISGFEGSIFSEFPLAATIQPQKTRAHAACLAILDSPRFSVVGVNILQAADVSGNTIGIYAENTDNFLCWTCAVSNFEVPSGNAHGIFASGTGRIENCSVSNFNGYEDVYGIRSAGLSVIDCEANAVSGVNTSYPIYLDGLQTPPDLHEDLYIGGSMYTWNGLQLSSESNATLADMTVNDISNKSGKTWVGGRPSATNTPLIMGYADSAWSQVTGIPAAAANEIESVFVLNDNNMYMASTHRFYHYDGTNWTLLEVAFDPASVIYNIGGISTSFIVTTGYSINIPGVDTYALMKYWNGSAYSTFPGNVLADDIHFIAYDAYVSPSSKVWCVGGHKVNGSGRMWYYNGVTMSIAGAPLAYEGRSIWGSSETNMWIVGTNSAIQHYDGTTRTDYTCPVANLTLLKVWGTDQYNVWAIGTDGFGNSYIFRFDADTDSWLQVYSGSQTFTNMDGTNA